METHRTILSKSRTQRWMRTSSVLISLAAATLLATAFGAHFYSGPVFSVLLVLVLIALCVAIILHAQFLVLKHREHRETVSVLDATERQYKSVFDRALDGILILDDQAACLEANPAAVALLGTELEELLGQSIERFFAGVEDFTRAWARFLDRGSEHRETRVLRGNGETIFVEYTAKAHYLPGRHVAVLRDITRRKQAEEALRESEERFRQMASNIQEVFWMLNYDILRFVSGFFTSADFPVFFGLVADWHSHLLEMSVLNGHSKHAFPLRQALNCSNAQEGEPLRLASNYCLPFH